jgi:hypothetical protein
MIIYVFLLLLLFTLSVSLIVARYLLWRRRPVFAVFAGITAGISLVALLELWRQARVRQCMTENCASLGLQANCIPAQFGCNEWNYLAQNLILMLGLADMVLFMVGFVIINRRLLKRHTQAESVRNS